MWRKSARFWGGLGPWQTPVYGLEFRGETAIKKVSVNAIRCVYIYMYMFCIWVCEI